MAAPTFTTRVSFSIARTFANPFDTIGAVSDEEIVVLDNGRYNVFNKAGVSLDSSTLTVFFNNLHASLFDPRIVYDPASERFFACAVSGKTTDPDSFLLINVSNSSQPSVDGWSSLSVSVGQSNEHWLDYPMIGFNADVVVISGKLFPTDAPAPDHTHFFAYVIPKSDLLLGTPTIANLEAVDIAAPLEFSHPIVDREDGSLPLSMWRWDPTTSIDRLDVTQPSAFSVDEVASIAYTDAIGLNGEQPDAVQALDHATDDRIGTYPVRIGGFVYIVLAGRNGSDSTLVVFKIDESTNTVTAQATIHESGLDLIYPAIAVNTSGNIVIGCTSSGSGVGDFASVMIFVGQDDGATLSFSAGEIVKEGQRTYLRLDANSRNRWGDYSAVVVDPGNEKRFWVFGTWAFDDGATDDGRKIEVTEVIVNPAGFRDLFALTMGWKSAAVFVPSGRVLLARAERRLSRWAATDRSSKWTAARRKSAFTGTKRT